jgi:ATP-dependent RNA helicase RhlE
LLDLMGSKDVRLDGIEILVLDEADHMLDMGFLPDIKRILAQLPKQRQNLLFSATMPREIRSLADRLLHDPHVADCAHSAPITTIEHALYPVDQNQKTALLRHLIAGEDFSSAIVFLRTKHRAKRLARDLDRAGHRAIALQGNMSQGQRERAMKGFRDGTYDVLVATDIAARGIDVPKVSHVINFDIPNTPDAYTHRIGRTGRSEESGKACTFVTHEDFPAIKEIERKLKMQIQRIKVRDFQRDEIGATSTGDQRPRRGRRVGGFAGRQGKTNRNGRTVNRGARPTASAPAKPARPARNGAHSNNGRPAHPAPNFGAGIRGPARQNGTDPRG